MGMSYKLGRDVVDTIEEIRVFTIPIPSDPDDKFNNIVDQNGKVEKSDRDKVSHVEDRIFGGNQ